MLASVPNPQEVFQNDEFLVQLAQQSNVRFSPYEHAPLDERRERFREAIAQRKLALTFIEAGVNICLEISSTTTSGNKIEIESSPFIFNGVLCTARGFIDSHMLTGSVRFRLCEEPNTVRDGNESWTAEQMDSLRAMGLPL